MCPVESNNLVRDDYMALPGALNVKSDLYFSVSGEMFSIEVCCSISNLGTNSPRIEIKIYGLRKNLGNNILWSQLPFFQNLSIIFEVFLLQN